VRYRYYVSCVIVQGRRHEAGSVARVAGPDIEAEVAKALADAVGAPPLSPSNVGPVRGCESPHERDEQDAFAALDRVVVAMDHLVLRCGSEQVEPAAEMVKRIPWRRNPANARKT